MLIRIGRPYTVNGVLVNPNRLLRPVGQRGDSRQLQIHQPVSMIDLQQRAEVGFSLAVMMRVKQRLGETEPVLGIIALVEQRALKIADGSVGASRGKLRRATFEPLLGQLLLAIMKRMRQHQRCGKQRDRGQEQQKQKDRLTQREHHFRLSAGFCCARASSWIWGRVRQTNILPREGTTRADAKSRRRVLLLLSLVRARTLANKV